MPPQTLDYASPPRHAGQRRTVGAAIALAAASLVAAVLGTTLVHRLLLFYGDYAGRIGLNHVADGTFRLMYQLGFLGTVAGAAAAGLARRRSCKALGILAAALNLLLMLAFAAMHRGGWLVEYSEWIKLYGP